MKEEEMLDIADLINDALNNRDDAATLEAIHGKVREMMRRFPLAVVTGSREVRQGGIALDH